MIYTNANLFLDKKKNRKLANIRSSLQFHGMIILVKTIPLCRGMARVPFQKLTMLGVEGICLILQSCRPALTVAKCFSFASAVSKPPEKQIVEHFFRILHFVCLRLRKIKCMNWGSKYSGDLNTKLVQYSNGPEEVGCQMVRLSNVV